MGRVPIVFSLQEQTEGSRGIFPKQFLEELNIQQIRYMTVSFYISCNYSCVTKKLQFEKISKFFVKNVTNIIVW